jgi:phosphate transport system substrate-binding protein
MNISKKQSLVARLGLGAVLGATVLAPSAHAATNLTGAGATFPYPIYSKWFSVYAQKGVQINYQAIGSGGGIQQLKNGTVDFGASDAPLTNGDMKEMPGAVVHIPTVAGAVAVVYNGLPKGLKLSGPVLAGIFLGQITRWNDAKIAALNPGVSLPNRAVSVAHRADGSGTSYIFTSYLKAVSPAWASQVGAGKAVNWPTGQGGKGNDGVASIVKQTPGGIGYVELAYAVQNHLPYAALKNKAGQFVLPSVGGVTAAAQASAKALQRDVRSPIVNASGAKSYPISGFTFILVYKNQSDKDKGKTLVTFLKWAISGTGGQKLAPGLLYAPLPRSIATIDAAKLRTVK